LLEPGAREAGARNALDVGALGLDGLLLQERDRLLIDGLGGSHPAVVKRRDAHPGYLASGDRDGDRQNSEVVIDSRTVEGPGPARLRVRRRPGLGRRT